MDTNQKLDLITGWVERWLGANPRRTIQMLSRQSAVPYATLRRVMQRETVPTTDTAMSLLNVIATLPECMSYFEGNESIQRFYSRVSAQTSIASPDMVEHYLDPQGFWIINLALSVGASRDNVTRLLGASGAEKFEEMIAEGVITEQSLGIYGLNSEGSTLFIENKKFAREAIRNVAAVPATNEALQRVIIYGVNEEGYREIEKTLMSCFQDCANLAEKNPGSTMAAFSFVGKKVAEKDSGGRYA